MGSLIQTDSTQSTSMTDLAALLDLDRYPIHDPRSARYGEEVALARASLHADGCAVLRGLVRPDAVSVLNDEIVARKHMTHYSTQNINPYFHTVADPAYPNRHPVNTFIERSSGFIPGDAWEHTCATDAIFRSEELIRFIADCLEMPTLYCYSDPLAGLTANILEPGQQFSWHFDTNDVAVTVLVDAAEHGGLFEYAPSSRTADDENFDGIQRILEGDRLGVRSLDLRPGDLQIFRGRHSLHRVTRVEAGSRPRHAAIFAYTTEPGVVGRLARTVQLFGRALPAHEAAELERVRADSLID